MFRTSCLSTDSPSIYLPLCSFAVVHDVVAVSPSSPVSAADASCGLKGHVTVSGQQEKKKGGGAGDRRRSSGRHRRGRADGEAAWAGYHSEGRRDFLPLLSIIWSSLILLLFLLLHSPHVVQPLFNTTIESRE